MIRLPDATLSATRLTDLANWQQEVNSKPSYAEQVAEAKDLWHRKNIHANATFRMVRRTLARMSGKLCRCAYCEDSCADEVEHIRPKDLYPESVFDWNNYLYACGICNVEKRNDFAVFPNPGVVWEDVKRRKGIPVLPPVSGDPVLIDPRRENPLDFMLLDLRDTFRFVPIRPKGTRDYERADYTIKVLGLNSRDPLVKARQSHYESYRDALQLYIQKRDAGMPLRQLKRRVAVMKRYPHQTVWKEMQRQGERIAELAPLFRQEPEAKDW